MNPASHAWQWLRRQAVSHFLRDRDRERRRIAELFVPKRSRASRRADHTETLEPRLMLAGDWYSAAGAQNGVDLTLRVTREDGSYVLELVDQKVAIQSAVINALSEPLRILGSNYADSFMLDFDQAWLTSGLTDKITISGLDGADKLRGPGGDIQWTLGGYGYGTVAAVAFDGFEDLEGASANNDTFHIGFGAGLDGTVDGGAQGFDSMVIEGTNYGRAVFVASGPNSGYFQLDDQLLQYAGLEPISLAGAADVVVGGSTGDDALRVSFDGSQITVASTTGTIESVSFAVPTSSLTINGAAGTDSVEFVTDLTLPNADLIVNSETITVTGHTISTSGAGSFGDITFNATAADTGIPLLGVAVVQPEAAINLNNATLVGGTIILTASATANAPVTVNDLIDELTPAVVVASADALVSVDGASSISSHTDGDSTGDLTISANAVVAVNLTGNSTTTGSTNLDVTAAVSVVDSSAVAQVQGTTAISAGGALTIGASNKTDVTTTANGTAGGTTALGAGVGLAFVDETSKATLGGSASVANASSVTISATSDSTVSTTGSASPNGAGPGQFDANTLINTIITAVNAITGPFGVPPIPGVTLPSLPTGDFAIAAGLGLSDVDSATLAAANAGTTLSTTGVLTVSSASDSDAQTSAVASTVDALLADDEVAAAAAFNFADSTNEASIGGNVTAGGLVLKAIMNHDTGDNDPDGVHTSAATATSGAGANDVGVAGALALNVVSNSSNALLKSGSTVAITGGGDVSISADNASSATSSAIPGTGGGGGNTGIGASVALNFSSESSKAALENSASLTGADDLNLLATGTHTITTTAQAGAQGGDTSLGASVAIGIPTGATEALIGTGPALSLSGALSVSAARGSAATTTAAGTTAGPDVGIGAAFALTVADETARSQVSRNVTTIGAGTINATIDGDSATNALAGAAGAPQGSAAAATLIGDWTTFVANQGWTSGPVPVPPAQTPEGNFGVAAALAINIASPKAIALVTAGSILDIGGVFVTATTNTYDTSSLANATAVNLVTSIAAALAIDVSTPTADATVAGAATGSSASVNATSVGVTKAEADSGAGASGVGVAGALAINIANGNTVAQVPAAASVLSDGAGGDVAVHASQTVTDEAVADASASGFPGTGVGASVALNIATNTVQATVAGSVSSTDQVNVEAEGDHTSNATAEGGATGGTAVAPALALNVDANTTKAIIAASAVVLAAGNMLVRAFDRRESGSSSKGGAAGTNTAVGAALAVNIATGSTRSALGGNATVTGGLTIESQLDDASTADAVAGAMGANGNSTNADTLVNDLLTFAQDPSRNWVPGSVDVPSAKQPDGALAIAAAVGVNVDVSDSTASLDAGAVGSAGTLTVRGLSDVDASATASGRVVDDGLTGHGIAGAIAVNVATPTTKGVISGSASGGAITVQSGMAGDLTHTYSAEAKSGAGSTGTTIAGSIAVNVASGTSEARVENGASVALSGPASLTVSAAYTTDNKADAKSVVQGEPDIGIGASIAVNTALNDTKASTGSATITGANSVAVSATGAHLVTTSGEAGAGPDASFGASIAVAVSASDTTAEIQNGPAALATTGSVSVSATHTNVISTTADSESAGANVGAGASIAVTVGLDDVTARVDRDINAGSSVAVSASSGITTNAAADAGQDGGFGSIFVDQQITDGLGISTANIPTLPDWVDILDDSENTTDIALPSMGAAAAIGVNVALQNTTAEIANGRSVHSTGGSVNVSSSVNHHANATADGSAIGNTANASLAFAANFAGGTNLARIGNNANIQGANILVQASDVGSQTMTVEANGGAAGLGAGAAGSIALNAGAVTTQAQVNTGDVLTATSNVTINADSDLASATESGAGAVGLGGGFGISVAGSLMQDLTEATVGAATINAGGTIAIIASGDQAMGSVGVAGAAAVGADIAGSIAVDAMVVVNRASTDVATQLNQPAAGGAGQNIVIRATGDSAVFSEAGAAGASLLANGSASVVGSVIQKNTLAILRGKADAGGNITVEALSTEDVASVSGTLGLSGLVSIAGTGGVHRIQATTQAFVDSGADVEAGGSVVVSADDSSEADASADSASLSGLVGAAGASVAAVWFDKVTEAFIAGADPNRADPFVPGGTLQAAKVVAHGNLPPVAARTGDFDITFGAEPSEDGEIEAPLYDIANAIGPIFDNDTVNDHDSSDIDSVADILAEVFKFLTVVTVPSVDSSFIKQRLSSPQNPPNSFKGIAVTATSRDDIETVARGLSGSAGLGISPEISGSAALVTNTTSAFVAAGAQALSDQSIRVAAGSDTYHMGIAGAASIGGLATVGASGNLSLFNNTTQAFVAGTADADQDVQIWANGKEDVFAIAAGMAITAGNGFGINLAASVPIISINSATHAFVDAGATVHAVGNVSVRSHDDTDTDAISGQASVGSSGGIGVGASVAVSLIDKDTQAYIAPNATVNADGDTGSTMTVANGKVSFDFDPLADVNYALNTINLHTDGLHTGDEVIYQALGGDEVDDLSDKTSYFVRVISPGVVKLFGSKNGALNNTGAIDFDEDNDGPEATGKFHRLYPTQQGALPTEDIHGLSVEAASTELIFGVAAAGGVEGGINLTGSLDFMIVDSDTAAYIDNGATVNAADVNVTGHNDARTFGAAVNLLLGNDTGLGVAGGFDVGLFRNDTSANIGGTVNAENDVEVHALSRIEADSFIAAIGAHDSGVSLEASVGLYSIRADFEPILTFDILGFLSSSITADTVQNFVDTQILNFATTQGGGGGGIATLLNQYAQGVGGGAQAVANAISQAAPVNPAQTAVQATLAASSGTQAYIDGANITAGGNVEVTGEESIDTASDSSFTFNFDLGDNALLALANDRSIMVTGGTSGGFIQGGSTVTAGGDVIVRGDVFNQQVIAATTAVNGTKNNVKAVIDDSTVTAGDDVDLLAVTNTQTVYSALLPALSLSTTLQTKSSDSLIRSTIDAHISGGATVTANDDVSVRAKDQGKIRVLANAATIKKKGLAVGVALSFNEVNNTVSAYIDSSTVDATNGDVDVKSTSVQDVQSIALGITAEGSDGKFAVAGSFGKINVHNTIEAYVNAGTVTGHGDVKFTAADSDGTDVTNMLTVTGGASLSLGKATVGAAVSLNEVTNIIRAKIDGGATVTAETGDIIVKANSDEKMNAYAIGVSGVAGDNAKFTAAGSTTLNTVNNTVEALVQADSTATATSGDVSITAEDNSGILADAGGFALAIATKSATGAIAASVAINTVTTVVRAVIDDSDVDTNNVTVEATAAPEISALTVAGEFGVSSKSSAFGGAGSGSGNTITSTTEALIKGESNVGGTSVHVEAHDNSTIDADAGTGALEIAKGGNSTTASIAAGAAAAVNEIHNTTTAEIDDSDVDSTGVLVVNADSSAHIDSLALAVAGALGVSQGGAFGLAGAGSGAQNTVGNHVNAIVQASDVTATTGLHITATDDTEINATIPSVNIDITVGQNTQVGVGLGFSMALDQISNETHAKLDNTPVSQTSTIEVAATSTSDIDADAIGVGLTISAGQSTNISADAVGAVSKNEIHNVVEAIIIDSDIDDEQVRASGPITVTGTDASTIHATAVAATLDITAGSGTTIGGSMAFTMADNTIGNSTFATISNEDVATTGANKVVTVAASSTSEITAHSVAASLTVSASSKGGVNLAGAGAESSNTVANTVDGAINGATVGATGAISVSATDDTTINSDVVAAVIGVAAGSSTSGGLAVGVTVAHNTITNGTHADVLGGASVTPATGLSVTATSDATIDVNAVAASIQVGGSGNYGLAGAGTGVDAHNSIGNTIEAGIKGDSVANVPQGVSVSASDTAKITSNVVAASAAVGAGSSGGVALAIAVSLADSSIADTTSAIIDDSKVTAGGNVSVNALADLDVDATSVGVVLAIAGGSSNALSGGGAAAQTKNSVNGNTSATISNADDGETQLVSTGGDLLVRARNLSSIDAVNVAGSLGVSGSSSFALNASIAVALAENKMGMDTKAQIINSHVTAPSGLVNVTSLSDATINATTAALALSVAGSGSVSISLSGAGAKASNVTSGDTGSIISTNSIVSGQGAVTLSATEQSHVDSDVVAAVLGVGASSGPAVSVGVALTFAENEIGGTTKAKVDHSNVSSTTQGVSLTALNKPKLDTHGISLALTVSGSGTIGANGTGTGAVVENRITSTDEATIANDSVVSAPGAVSLSATEDSELDSLALAASVGVTGSSTASITATVAVATSDNKMTGTTRASINDSDVTSTLNSVSVTALDTADLDSTAVSAALSVTAAGSFSLGLTGAGAESRNTLSNTVEASVLNSDPGETQNVTANNNVSLSATDQSKINSDTVAAAATISASGGASIAASVAESISKNTVDTTVSAKILNSEIKATNGSVGVHASSQTDIDTSAVAVAASITGSSGLAVGLSLAGADASNDTNGLTEARIGQDSIVDIGGAVSVTASDSSTINVVTPAIAVSVGGSGGGSIQIGVATAIAHNEIGSTTRAIISDSDVDTNTGLTLTSTNTALIDADGTAVAVGAGGAAGFAISGAGTGAIVKNIFTGTTESEITADSVVNVPGALTIAATNDSTLNADAIAASVTIAGSSAASIGLSFSLSQADNQYGGTTKTLIDDSDVTTGSSLTLDSKSTADLNSNATAVAVSATFAGGVAVSLSAAVSEAKNTLTTNVQSLVKNSDAADGQNIDVNGGSMMLTATDQNKVTAKGLSAAVSFGGAGAASINLSLALTRAVNTLGTQVLAKTQTSDIDAPSLTVKGLSDNTVLADAKGVAVSVGGAGGLAVNLSGAGAEARNDGTGSLTDAIVGTGTVVNTTGAVTVDSQQQSSTDAEVTAVAASAGGAGGAAISGSVALAKAENQFGGSTRARTEGATITNSPGGLTITALSNADIDAKAVGVAASFAGAGGVSLAGAGVGGEASNVVTATTEAAIAADSVVDTPAPVTLTSTDTSDVDANVVGVAVSAAVAAGGSGSLGITISQAHNDYQGTTRSIIDDSKVTSSNAISLTSGSQATIDADATGVSVAVSGSIFLSISGAATGSTATNTVGGTVESVIRNSNTNDNQIVRGSSVALSATDNTATTADADAASISGSVGLAGGSIAISAAIARNTANSTTRTGIENSKVQSTSGDVSGTATSTSVTTATPDAIAISFSIAFAGLAGAGAGAEASNTTTRVVESYEKTGSNVISAGKVLLKANDTSTATADVFSFALSAGVTGAAAGVGIGKNTLNNRVSSYVDGSSATAQGGNIELDSDANNNITTKAEIDVISASLAGVAAAGGDAQTTINGTVESYGNNANLTASGLVLVDSDSVETATAAPTGVTAGPIALSKKTSTTKIGGTTQSYVSGNSDINSSQLQVTANSTNTSTAHADAFGLGAVSVSTIKAVSEGTRVTQAFIGNGSDVDVPSGIINLAADATNVISADVDGLSVGLVTIGLLQADNTLGGATRAFVGEGSTVDAIDVDLSSHATNTVTDTVKSVGVGLVDLADIKSTAKDTSVTEAFVGRSADNGGAGATSLVTTTGGGQVDVHATSDSTVTAEAKVLGISLAGGNKSTTQADGLGTTRSYLGNGGGVNATAGGDIDINADATAKAIAKGSGVAIGLGIGFAGAFATSNLNPTVKAFTVGGGQLTGDQIKLHADLNLDGGGAPIFADVDGNSVAPAFATATLGAGSLGVGIAGAIIDVTNSPTMETGVGSGTVVNANAITIEGDTFQKSQTDALAVAVGFGAGVGVAKLHTISNGNISSHFDGNLQSANSLRVTSNVNADTLAEGQSVGAGLGGGVALATINSDTNPTVSSYIGGGSLTTSGDILVESLVQTKGRAVAEAKSFGIFVAAADIDVTANANPVINTYIAGGANVTSTGGNVTLRSANNFDFNTQNFLSGNQAHAGSESVSGSLFLSISSTDSTAEASANVQTHVDPGANIMATSGKVTLATRTGNFALADADSVGGGLIKVSGGDPIAKAIGTAKASLLGNVGGTTTGFGADGVSGTLGVAGAKSIEVTAVSADRTISKTNSEGGGAIAVDDSTSEATSHPTVRAEFGAGNVTASDDITLIAEAHPDADAFASSAQGGAIDIQLLHTTASINPDVDAVVGGGLVQAGKTLTINAINGNAPTELSDGTITGVDTGTNTISFAKPHGVTNADTVTYVANGTIGGLHNGRTYGLIVTSPTAFKLGVAMVPDDGDGIDEPGEFTRDNDQGSLVFKAPHNLESGDLVRYEADGTPIAELTNNHVYEVVKLDSLRLKLKEPGAGTPQKTFNANVIDAGSDTIHINGHNFADNQAVTYHAPAPVGQFTADMTDVNIVDTTVNGNTFKVIQRDSNGQRVHDASKNNIYLPDHGLSTNDVVQYTTDGAPIQNLTNGGYYQVVVETNASIKLRPVGGGAIIDIAPGSGSGTHTIRRVGQVPVGLTDGDTYYVEFVDADHFKLRTRPDSEGGGSIVNLINTLAVPVNVDTFDGTADGVIAIQGSHQLKTEGISIFHSGSGTMRLVVDLTSGGGGQMVGVGGPRALVGNSGDDTANSTSSGVGGGAISVRNSQSDSFATANVNATVNGGSTLRANDIVINAQSRPNVSSVSSNAGGAFIDVGDSRADGDIHNNVNAAVNGSANVVAGRDVKIFATGVETANGESRTDGGGFVGIGDANSTMHISRSINTSISGRVYAVRTLLDEARSGLNANVYGNADTGGLGADADANDDGSHGVRLGGQVQASLGGTANVYGGNVYISAQTGKQHDLDALGGVVDAAGAIVTSTFAHARSDADADGVGTDSDAAAVVVINDLVEVLLAPGSEITSSDHVDLHARHDNNDLVTIARASSTAVGGDTDSTATVDYNSESRVTGQDGSIVRTSKLEVDTFQDPGGITRDADSDGALFDGGSEDENGASTRGRDIYWESTVILLGEPNPFVTVDSAGTIVAVGSSRVDLQACKLEYSIVSPK